ncbi:MAG TPA: arginine--tRNA ligase, partial [Steroidobacteraceae bacterium]|nr:arginine--tRNA ligase [Steroidobacteraceae bacterium]
MKEELSRLIVQALQSLPSLQSLVGTPAAPGEAAALQIERTRDPSHGDYSSNIALRLARIAGVPPRELAEAIARALPPSPLLAGVEVAGPGFLNFRITQAAQRSVVLQVLEAREHYGESRLGQGRRVLLEYVSANPTGPLHVGHGRQAAYGATLASLLAATGHEVQREYYINDAGRQMDILTVSTWMRYLERCGEPVAFPSNGYRGDYVRDIAAQLYAQQGPALRRPAPAVLSELPADAPAGDKEQHIDALIERMRTLLGGEAVQQVHQLSLSRMLTDIRSDLEEFGVQFDRWYSERELTDSGAVERAIETLRAAGHLYEKDGAVWFRASRFGDDEDRVLLRANGQPTYFAPDIAYHLQKCQRGFEHLIDVLGADHHGYVARVRGALMAMGQPEDRLEACLIQFVSLFRNGEKIPMGKREAQFVTLRELRAEVGNDACRLFYLMRSHDQHLDFDLTLARSRSNENPVYYIQYAHARVASVMKQLAARNLQFDAALAGEHLALLRSEHEQGVARELARYPEVVAQAASARAPHA